jgi:hypothetical protein
VNSSASDGGLNRTVRFVALANLAYFGIEFAVALTIGSVSLFADSIDFLEATARDLEPHRFCGIAAPTGETSEGDAITI